MTAAKTIHTLIVEHRAKTLHQLTAQMSQAGYQVVADYADSEASLTAAFRTHPWDIIFATQPLAYMVLEQLHTHELDIPVIVIFEVMDDETANLLMRAGADDVFTISNLNRLMPAVEREIADARERHQRRVAEAKLREQSRYDALLHEIALVVNEAVSESEALQLALNAICTCLEAPVGHVYLRENDDLFPSEVWYFQSPARFEKLRQLTEYHPANRNDDFIWRVFTTGKPVWQTEISRDTQLFRKQALEEAGLITGFAFPVLKGESVTAVLEFFSDRPLPQTDIIVKVLEQAASLLSRVIEREQARQALELSQQRLASIFEQTQNGILLVNDTLTCLDANPAFCQLLGVPQAALINQPLLHSFQDADRTEFTARWIEFLQTGKQSGEYSFQRRDGQQIIVDYRAITHMVPGVHLIVTTDITARKQQEQEISEAKTLLDQTFASLTDAVLVVQDKTRTIIMCNPAVESVLGYQPVELMGQETVVLFGDDEAYRAIQALAAPVLDQQESYMCEYPLQKKGGQIFLAEVTISPVPMLRGETKGVVFVIKDIMERKRQELELLTTKTLLEQTFASINEMVFVVEPNTRTILICNAAVERVLGYKPEEIIGKNTSILFPSKESYQRFADLYTRAIEAHGSFQTEYEMQHRNGKRITIEATLLPFQDDNRWTKAMVGVLRDITDRKQIEQAEQEQRILAEALRDTIAALTSTLDLQEVMKRILDNVGRVVPHESANIMLIQGSHCHIEYMHGYSQEVQKFLQNHRFSLELPNLHAMLMTRKPYLVTDGANDPAWVVIPGTEWIRSHLGVPICRQGQVIGFINLDSTVPGFFNLDHSERLQAFADQAAIAIENAQVYVTLSQYANEMASLNRATSYLFAPMSTSQGIEELGKQIVAAVVKALGKVDCGIMLVDETTNQLIRLAREGEYAVQATTPLYLDGPGLAPEAIRLKEMVYAPEVSADPRYVRSDPRTRSELVIPLQTQNRMIGILDLQSDQPDAFSVNDQRLLKAFAERAANAIENARLYREVQRHAEELEQRVAERTLLLEQAREHVEAILNSSSDGVAFAYTDGTIRQTNPAFDDLFGYEIDESFGKSLIDLVLPNYANQIRATIDLVSMKQSSERLETTVVRKDGQVFEAEIALSTIQGRNHSPAGLVCTFHDISQHKQIEEYLRNMLEREREIGELKNRLVSMVSHEFRTPLATIQVTAESLENYYDRLDDEQRSKRFERIRLQIKHMTNLLEDALTLSRGESDGLKLTPTQLDLSRFCQGTADEVRATMNKPNPIIFTHRGDCADFMTDERLLRQIVTNLLTNAIKYSPDGGEVHFELVCESDRIILKVSDKGIGIPDKDKKLLFEAFHRAKNVGTISGTGLGLTITKQAVDMLGGKISFESEDGHGTTFTVVIPSLQE